MDQWAIAGVPEAAGTAFPLPPLVPADFPCQPRPLPNLATPLVEELSATLDPWDACTRLAGLKHLIFFDSAARDGVLGRFSFLAADPFRWLTSRGRRVWIDGVAQATRDPFAALATELAEFRPARLAELPPFQGGAAGLFGYELCHHIERLPHAEIDEFRVPDLAVGLYDWTIAFDHANGRTWLVSTGLPERDPRRRHERAAQRIRMVRALLQGRGAPAFPRLPGAAVALQRAFPLDNRADVVSSFSRAEYLDSIRRAIEYVHAGDCFQVNLAQRLAHPLRESPLAVYGALRERNRAPFAGYFDLGDFAIASASPERFARVAEGEVEARPIKGTRPRGGTPADDERLRRELVASAKDRAENVMIIDLLRNDLGRVCAYGSVRVTDVCRLESHAYVHHLVSQVRGTLRAGLGPIELLRAAFPGGSVTGAPKVRAMEIIAELEHTSRGAYCGSLGYIGFEGTMDTNILIRTFTAGRGWLQFPVGGGIVADSDPEAEYAETLHKAEGMLRAVRTASE